MKRLVAVAVLATAMAGCSNYKTHKGIKDAPHDKGDNKIAHIVNMPDGYANIARKCDGPNGIYVTTREAPPVVVVNDPNCGGQR